MAINKIAIDGTPLIDLSTDTVASANDIALGKVGHLNTGEVVTGTHQKDINLSSFSVEYGSYIPAYDTKTISIITEDNIPDNFFIILHSEDCKISEPKENIMVFSYGYLRNDNNYIIPISIPNNSFRMLVKMPDGTQSFYSSGTQFKLNVMDNMIQLGISSSNTAYFEGGKKYEYVYLTRGGED